MDVPEPGSVRKLPEVGGLQHHDERITTTALHHRLTRIIHQPAKSTGEVDFVVQMSDNSTVSQVAEAPQSISSGRPDTVSIDRMGATGRTVSCQPPEAYLNSLVGEPLGLSIAPHRAR
jgi:hypothetical protein